MKELMYILFKIAEKVDGRTDTWHPILEHRQGSGGQVISLQLLQVGQPVSVFAFTALTAMVEVVLVAHGHLFGLVPN